MARIIPDRGTDLAMAVVALANQLMEEGGDDPHYFHGISRYKTSGVHIRNYHEQRAISVLNHDVSDGVLIVYGTTGDFEYPSGFAKDSAGRWTFEFNEIHHAAQMVREWLEEGTHNPLVGQED